MKPRAFWIRQYVELRKSGVQIQREFGLYKNAAYFALEKFGIPRRPYEEARRQPPKSRGPTQTKWCPRCRKNRLLRNFNKGKGRFGCDSYCRDCTRAIHKAKNWNLHRRHYNKAKMILERGNRCAKCGAENLPLACLQFHHRDRAKKEKWISYIMASPGRHLAEFAKCDLLCAHCHLAGHFGSQTATDVMASRQQPSR